jgi:hypothetical protein
MNLKMGMAVSCHDFELADVFNLQKELPIPVPADVRQKKF